MRFFGGEDGDFIGCADTGAFESFPEDGLLEGELGCVVGVLIVASATCAEVAARGGNTLRRGVDDGIDFSGGVTALVPLVLGDADGCVLAGEGEWNEDGLTFDSSEEGAAVDGFFDVDELGCRS